MLITSMQQIITHDIYSAAALILQHKAAME
jgi:hypothetical protein